MAKNLNTPNSAIRMMNQQEWDVDGVIGWVFEDGRLATDPKIFVERLGRQLIKTGAPL